MALVLEHPHRLGPDEPPVWDHPVWIMESYGAAVDVGAAPEITPSPRNALGPDTNVHRHLGSD